MPVKRTDNSKSLLAKIEQKAKLTMNIVLAGARARSDEKAPVEYSTLVNSAFTEVKASGYQVHGTFGYMTDYAAFLNNTTNWKPRPINMKKGPATNMNATPHFLDYHGFESPEAKAEIENDIKTGMKL